LREEQIYGGHVDGLKKAATAVNDRREQGIGIDPSLVAPDTHAHVEKPIDPTHDGGKDAITVGQAGVERADRSANELRPTRNFNER
jgi:hypothetical protein